MTPRQKQLLAAIISEFIETANAVGSVSLYDKYKFNVSPATIRNEMASLVREGYLDKEHSSAGRTPTTMGLRYFIEELIDQYDDLDVVTKEQMKQKFHNVRFDKETLIREGIHFLATQTHNAALALVGKDIYYAGLSDMLDIPEFQEIDNLRRIMVVLEDYSALSAMFNRSHSVNEVKVLIGEETGLSSFDEYAVVFSDLKLHGGINGFIAVVGPNRIDYRKAIPMVSFVAQTIGAAVRGW